jgi:hypothetical protein
VRSLKSTAKVVQAPQIKCIHSFCFYCFVSILFVSFRDSMKVLVQKGFPI